MNLIPEFDMPQPPTFDELPPLDESGAQQNANSFAPPLAPMDDGYPWLEAIGVAWEVIALLSDLCSRITVGGSLRRGKPRVGDIEILCRPAHPLAFAKRCERLLAAGRFAFRLNKNGVRIAWADRERCIVFRGFPVDLFIVQPDRPWGPTCLIRTGGNAANQVLVTTEGRLSTLGDAGVLPPGLKFDDGRLWRNGVILDTPEEIDVFEACGLPWIEPGLRSVELYQTCAAARQAGQEHRHRRMGDPPIPWEYVKFNANALSRGRWYWLHTPTLLERRPALAAEVASLQAESEVDLIKQAEMF